MREGEFQEFELSLLETVDHVLTRGLVIAGEVVISVAGTDLIFLGLNLVVGSVQTMEEVLGHGGSRSQIADDSRENEESRRPAKQ